MQAKKKHRKWPWIVVIVLIAGLIAVLLSFGQKARSSYKQETVQNRDLRTYYSFSGHLAPATDEQQTAKAPLKVKELFVKEGDIVDKGQALLRGADGTRVSAQYAGTVETIFIEEDDQLQPGSPIARIVDYDDLQVEINVDEYDVDALTLGREGEVYVNALGRSLTAEVTQIAREATVTDAVSFYAVKMRPQPAEGVRSGMSVEVSVLKQQALSAPSLPVKALSYDEYNQPYVLVMENEQIVSRPVELGVSDGLYTQIISGVGEGDAVYYTENDLLRFFAMRGAMGGGN